MALNIYYSDSASGSLFWDDGESDFEEPSGTLKTNVLLMNYSLENNRISAECFSPEGHSGPDCYFSLEGSNNNELEKIRVIGAPNFTATLDGSSLTVQDAGQNVQEILLDGVKINDQWNIDLSL